MFICIEHEQKPLKLKGNKVIPSLIGKLDKDSLVPGTYVGLYSGLKVKLLNEGGFVQADPHLRALYEVANICPATLGEEAAAVRNNEVFSRANGDVQGRRLLFRVLLHDLRKEDEERLRDFWIPGSVTYANGRNRGWVNLKNKEMLLESRSTPFIEANELYFESSYKFNSQRIPFVIKL